MPESFGSNVESLSGSQARLWLAAAVLCVAIFAALVVVERNPQWIPDSYGYAVQLLTDRGVPMDEATAQARSFYLTDPLAKATVTAQLLKGPLPEFGFIWSERKTRVVYSGLASLLFPWRGFYALLDVSAIAYVMTAVAVYFLLLEFCVSWLAAIGACSVAITPEYLLLGESAGTDMLGLLWWTIALIAMCRIVKAQWRNWLVILAASSLFLDFTRPVAFMPFCAAASVAVVGLCRHDRVQLFSGRVMTVVTGLSGVILLGVSYLEGVPGLAAILPFLHAHAITYFHASATEPFRSWYGQTVAFMAATQAKLAVRSVFPLAAFGGMVIRLDNPAAPLLIGAAVGAAVSMLVNPSPPAALRVIDAPLYPVIAAGIVALVTALWARWIRRPSAISAA